jgi:GNAT superfamily N-acetyltransferase
MPDQDIAAARREITDALMNALDRRHELLDAIVDSEDRGDAVAAIRDMLGTSARSAEAVIGLSFDRLTKASRRAIAKELDDLNSQLSFAVQERLASLGDSVTLRPFCDDSDRDIFAARTEDMRAAGDGSGGPAGSLDSEIKSAMSRVAAEEAAWFVAMEGPSKVGMVFGELADGEVSVRIWIHPDYRKRGYGTAALRRSRSQMAAYFPAVPMVVRAPGA